MKKKVFILWLLFISAVATAQPLTPMIDSIPMRDGKKLAADIYVPSGTQQRPTILIQTPYNRIFYRYNLPIGIGLLIDSCNYNIVTVDWRGFYGSVSAWTSNPDRGEDGYDIIDWIITQTWSDGQVGTWGPSALGKIQYLTAREQHTGHICAVPLVAGSQYNYLEYYPGGVYRTEYVQQLDALGYGMSTTLLANPFYNYLWQYVENDAWYPSSITIPMLMIGGWYDHNTDLMLELFNGLLQQSPASTQHRLLMGPWAHGGFGPAQVGTALQGELYYYEAQGWSDSLAMMFFDYHLLSQTNGWDGTPVITYFRMGENIWENTPVWPPSSQSWTALYLTNSSTLDINPPPNTTGSSTFIYDPHDPSPSYGGKTLRQDLLQGPYDQADTVESRNDILIFDTPWLLQDTRLTGSPTMHLFISSDRKDTDFAVRLTDVYPNGRSMLVAEGIKRMRFRTGYTVNDTASMIPGQVYEAEIELENTAITFLAGHKIRLDITSSNYPRFDNNLNNGGTMYTAGDTLVATNHVYHNQSNASWVSFPFDSYVQGIAAEKEKHNTYIRIYPNPASNIIHISTFPEEITTLTISDITGKTILKVARAGDSELNADISEFEKGLYIINIQTSKGENHTSRFIRD
ncbi:MAG: CocE/NonD family hydrolase [Bacteroidota bacterium]